MRCDVMCIILITAAQSPANTIIVQYRGKSNDFHHNLNLSDQNICFPFCAVAYSGYAPAQLIIV